MSVKAAVTLWPGPDSYFTAPAVGLCNQSGYPDGQRELLLKQIYRTEHLNIRHKS